jgi:hypothetical protein
MLRQLIFRKRKMMTTRDLFLGLSSELTGYSQFDLEGTGLVNSYKELLENILGPSFSSEFYTMADSILSAADADILRQNIHDVLLPPSIFRPVVSSLIALWYLGSWNQLPDSWYAAVGLPVPDANEAGSSRTPSELAYVEQLSYPAVGAHTPGAKPTGFGSWSREPVH